MAWVTLQLSAKDAARLHNLCLSEAAAAQRDLRRDGLDFRQKVSAEEEERFWLSIVDDLSAQLRQHRDARLDGRAA
jgi:hypothetical protein